MTNKLSSSVDIGIIGGSGFYEIDGFSQTDKIDINTPFGKPSDSLILGELNGVQVAFLPRHGAKHQLLPSELNYRANIYALKSVGVSHIVAITAGGSLRQDRPPLDLVIPDQIIDRTVQRKSSFFGDGIVSHVSFAEPFCPVLSQLLYDTASQIVDHVHPKGTLITIEGPAFSTKAESKLYQQWGADIIGMTTCQEAKLAREAQICYAALAMVTDYDCWKDSPADEVTVETVVLNMKKNSKAAKDIVSLLLPRIERERNCKCPTSLKGSIMTDANFIDEEARSKVALLLGD